MPQRADPAPRPLLTIVDHPLVQHKLALMRAADSSTSKFRQLTREISLLLGYEATRELQVEDREIMTPLEAFKDRMLVLRGVSNRVRGDGDNHMRGTRDRQIHRYTPSRAPADPGSACGPVHP